MMKRLVTIVSAVALFTLPFSAGCSSKADTSPAVVVEPGKADSKTAPAKTETAETPTTVKVTETATPAVPATGEPAKTVTETKVTAPADAKVTVPTGEAKSGAVK